MFFIVNFHFRFNVVVLWFCFSDCGLFVLSFAEYFVDTKLIPSELDMELHRDRLAVSLYKYARMKEIDLRDSSDEAPPKKSKK